jgi:hypothetical protein
MQGKVVSHVISYNSDIGLKRDPTIPSILQKLHFAILIHQNWFLVLLCVVFIE